MSLLHPLFHVLLVLLMPMAPLCRLQISQMLWFALCPCRLLASASDDGLVMLWILRPTGSSSVPFGSSSKTVAVENWALRATLRSHTLGMVWWLTSVMISTESWKRLSKGTDAALAITHVIIAVYLPARTCCMQRCKTLCGVRVKPGSRHAVWMCTYWCGM